jgi:hypothetical protein
LVENTGFDGSGIHCLKTSYQFQNISNKNRFKKNKNFFYDQKENSRIRKMVSKNIDEGVVKKTLKKIFYFNLLSGVIL